MRLLRFRPKPEPTARAVRDDWLEWLRLSNYSPLTIKGYRLTTTDRLLDRWPELSFSEFTDATSSGPSRSQDRRRGRRNDPRSRAGSSGACGRSASSATPSPRRAS
jgi:hypothetical protein